MQKRREPPDRFPVPTSPYTLEKRPRSLQKVPGLDLEVPVDERGREVGRGDVEHQRASPFHVADDAVAEGDELGGRRPDVRRVACRSRRLGRIAFDEGVEV